MLGGANMQNKENGFGRFVKEKGYYIVLLLCAVAIGVSGYLLLSGKNSDQHSVGAFTGHRERARYF